MLAAADVEISSDVGESSRICLTYDKLPVLKKKLRMILFCAKSDIIFQICHISRIYYKLTTVVSMVSM